MVKRKVSRGKTLAEIFGDDLVLSGDDAMSAATNLAGNSIEDLAENIGYDLAIKLCKWIAKASGFRECENCGKYEETLTPIDGFGEFCEQCKDDTAEDREDED